MTNHVTRLYVAAGSLLVFFLTWAGIATHPSVQSAAPRTSRTQALSLYEQRLQRDAALLRQLSSQSSVAPAPSVRVVTLPPLTTTRTS